MALVFSLSGLEIGGPMATRSHRQVLPEGRHAGQLAQQRMKIEAGMIDKPEPIF